MLCPHPACLLLCVVHLLHLSGCIICSTIAASKIRSSTPAGTTAKQDRKQNGIRQKPGEPKQSNLCCTGRGWEGSAEEKQG